MYEKISRRTSTKIFEWIFGVDLIGNIAVISALPSSVLKDFFIDMLNMATNKRFCYGKSSSRDFNTEG